MKKKWTKSILFCILLVSSLTAYSQNTIRGTVTDQTGLPLAGVNITENGSSKTTSTNFDGKFEINIPANSILSFSFTGFDTQKISVAEKTTINVVLKSSSENLKEVVVVGYGSVKKADLTGSVSTIKTKALEDIPTNSIEQVLQGRVAGLQVTTSQDPGSSSTVRIRGGSSLRGSNAPLVVLDGFPLGDAGDLKQVNVADIEKVDILKDASASAIYGSRGANGVIIITTKSAKKGKTQILVQQQTTISEFNSELNLWRDPVLMAQLSNEGRINGGQTPLYVGAENSNGVYYPSIQELETGSWPYFTKWDNVTFRDAPIGNNTTVSINSGTDKTSFNLSANYFSEEGVFVKDGYSKGGYNLRVKHDVFDNFTVRFSNIISKGNRNSNGGLAYWRNPIFPVYDDNGDYYMIGDNDYTHPVAITNLRQNETKTIDVISSASLEWQVVPTLRLTSRLNYKYGSSINDQYFPSKYTETGDFNNGAGYINNWVGENFVSETFANYNETFNKHEFGVTGGFTYENYVSRNSGLGAFDFVNETLGNENMSAGNPERNSLSNGKVQTELVSGIFRINYGYDNKYLMTITGRADGSSKFGANNQWAVFPSGALSWKAHNEEFIKNLNFFDELKFRLSYGISGNQGISPYQTLSRYGVSQYFDNGNWVPAIGPGYQVGTTGQDGIEKLWGGIPNPDLKWETTAQSDFGVDMSILNNRLHVVFDYYNKQTKDLLRERILTPSSGYDRIWVNDGELSNKGFEVTLNGEIFKNQDWTINSTVVYSKNENEILSLGSVEQSGLNVDPNTGMQYEYSGNSLEQFRQFPNLLAIGQPINVFYGYKVEGVVQDLQEGINAGLDGQLAQAGEFKYVDINKDGVVDTKDQTIIGNPNPDFMASFDLSLKYKQFDFSFFLNGVFGQDVLDTQAFNQPSNAPLRWTLDNPTNDYPSLRDGRTLKLSDWWIKDGSFVRIQNITIGYTLKPIKSTIQSLRLYLNANNVYTFTNFDGYDPEVGADGIYWGGYPRLSKMTLGLDLTF